MEKASLLKIKWIAGVFLLFISFSLQAQITTFPYAENFTGGQGGWTSGGINSSWAFGVPNKTDLGGARTGTQAWALGGLGGGSYNNSEQSFLLSPQFDFSVASGAPIFSFWMKFNLESNWDGIILQYTTNGIDWQTISEFTSFPYNNDFANNPVFGETQFWTGFQDQFVEVRTNRLLDLVGESTVQFRLGFESNIAVPFPGAVIDDFSVVLSNDFRSFVSGDWNNPNNWTFDGDSPAGAVPGPNDKVEIRHQIVLDSVGTISLLDLTIVSWTQLASLNLTNITLNVRNNLTLEQIDENSPISSLTLNNAVLTASEFNLFNRTLLNTSNIQMFMNGGSQLQVEGDITIISNDATSDLDIWQISGTSQVACQNLRIESVVQAMYFRFTQQSTIEINNDLIFDDDFFPQPDRIYLIFSDQSMMRLGGTMQRTSEYGSLQFLDNSTLELNGFTPFIFGEDIFEADDQVFYQNITIGNPEAFQLNFDNNAILRLNGNMDLGQTLLVANINNRRLEIGPNAGFVGTQRILANARLLLPINQAYSKFIPFSAPNGRAGGIQLSGQAPNEGGAYIDLSFLDSPLSPIIGPINGVFRAGIEQRWELFYGGDAPFTNTQFQLYWQDDELVGITDLDELVVFEFSAGINLGRQSASFDSGTSGQGSITSTSSPAFDLIASTNYLITYGSTSATENPLGNSYRTIQDGTWENPATWETGVVPGSAENVLIRNIVTLNSERQVRSINIASEEEFIAPIFTIQPTGILNVTDKFNITSRFDSTTVIIQGGQLIAGREGTQHDWIQNNSFSSDARVNVQVLDGGRLELDGILTFQLQGITKPFDVLIDNATFVTDRFAPIYPGLEVFSDTVKIQIRNNASWLADKGIEFSNLQEGTPYQAGSNKFQVLVSNNSQLATNGSSLRNGLGAFIFDNSSTYLIGGNSFVYIPGSSEFANLDSVRYGNVIVNLNVLEQFSQVEVESDYAAEIYGQLTLQSGVFQSYDFSGGGIILKEGATVSGGNPNSFIRGTVNIETTAALNIPFGENFIGNVNFSLINPQFAITDPGNPDFRYKIRFDVDQLFVDSLAGSGIVRLHPNIFFSLESQLRTDSLVSFLPRISWGDSENLGINDISALAIAAQYLDQSIFQNVFLNLGNGASGVLGAGGFVNAVDTLTQIFMDSFVELTIGSTLFEKNLFGQRIGRLESVSAFKAPVTSTINLSGISLENTSSVSIGGVFTSFNYNEGANLLEVTLPPGTNGRQLLYMNLNEGGIFSKRPILVTNPAAVPLTNGIFESAGILRPVSAGSSKYVFADLNGDQKQDFVALDSATKTLRVYFSNPSNTWNAPTIVDLSSFPYSLNNISALPFNNINFLLLPSDFGAITVVDNDENGNIAFTGASGAIFSNLTNVFETQIASFDNLGQIYLQGISVGKNFDLENWVVYDPFESGGESGNPPFFWQDRLPDGNILRLKLADMTSAFGPGFVVLTDSAGGTLSTYRYTLESDPDQMFTLVNNTVIGGGAQSVEITDVTNNGILDLIVIRNTDVLIRQGFGGVNGGFSVANLQTIPKPAGTIVTLADMNGDGLEDLVFVSTTAISIYENLAAGNFATVPFTSVISLPSAPTYAAAIKFNDDEFPDMVIRSGNNLHYFENKSFGLLEAPLVSASDFEVLNLSAETLDVQFTPSSDAVGHLVLRRTTGTDPFLPNINVLYTPGEEIAGSTVVAVGIDTLLSDAGLTPLTSYTYSVFPYNQLDSAISYKVVDVLEGVVVTLPASPILTLLDTTCTSATVTITYGGSSTNFLGRLALDSAFTQIVPGFDSLAFSTTNYVIAGLEAETSYYFQVLVEEGGLLSEFSTPLEILTSNLPILAAIDDLLICQGDTIPTFLAVGENITWYADAALSIVLANTNAFSPTLPADTTGVFSYYFTSTVGDCVSAPQEVSLTIFELTELEFVTVFESQYNKDFPAFELEALPLGGEFSGPGVFDGFFIPEAAGPGEHTITYTFINANDCASSITINVEVLDLITVSQVDIDAARALFTALNGATWSTNPNWEDPNVENWLGVEVENNRISSLELSGFGLSGELPVFIRNLSGLKRLDLSNNQITGVLPNSLRQIRSLAYINVSNNAIQSLPNLSVLPLLDTLFVSENRLEFDDLEPNAGITVFSYAPQAEITEDEIRNVRFGNNALIPVFTSGANNSFQWYKDGEEIEGALSNTLTINNADEETIGEYYLEVNNSLLQDLTLRSGLFRINVTGSISGIVSRAEGSSLVESGQMYLFAVEEGQPYDTISIVNLSSGGQFVLEDLDLRRYILFAFPDTTTYPDDLATYFESQIFWDEADVINLRGNLEGVNFNVLGEPAEEFGDRRLLGTFERELLENGRLLERTRVANARVTVRRSTSTSKTDGTENFELVAITFTDENGQFSFNNLIPALYRIKIDLPGVPMNEARNIDIDLRENNSTEIRASITQNNQIEVEEVKALRVQPDPWALALYPNPASDLLEITWFAPNANTMDLVVTDLSGKMIMERTIEGQNQVQLQVKDWKQGLYIIQIKDRRTQMSSFKRLIIQK